LNQEGWQLSGPRREVDEKALKRLRARFRKMMGALFQEQGATLRIEILEDPAVQEFIGTHAGILDSAFQEERMSDSLRDRLRETDWMFSGYKTFHELNEAFPSLVDESGSRKPFDRFLKDVQSIDETYNRNWLRAEYNFAGASAQMAAKWERYAEEGDDYYLQYRTANDGAVRPEHAALHGVTLPQSDSFWDTYYPPNGWNCRCTVVQVRKSKYEQTPHDEAMAKGAAALAKDTKGMFRFNPGKQKSAFPAYNPYTISKCRTCDKSQFRLAASIPDNELCKACLLLSTCSDSRAYIADPEFGHRLMVSSRADLSELEPNIDAARDLLKCFPDAEIRIRPHVKEKGVSNPEYEINGLIADRKGIQGYNGVINGFIKAIEQGCKTVYIDMDMGMQQYPLRTIKMSNKLYGRHQDFESGAIVDCYVKYKHRVARVSSEDFEGTETEIKKRLQGILETIKE
jgi:SPP1 gp7 family putative phage head morphogenesis protein